MRLDPEQSRLCAASISTWAVGKLGWAWCGASHPFTVAVTVAKSIYTFEYARISYFAARYTCHCLHDSCPLLFFHPITPAAQTSNRADMTLLANRVVATNFCQ